MFQSPMQLAGQRLLLNIVFISGRYGFKYHMVTSLSFGASENSSDNRTKEEYLLWGYRKLSAAVKYLWKMVFLIQVLIAGPFRF